MLIVPLVVGGAMQENTYIVGSEETKECVIIDPGAEADLILEEVQNLGLTVKYILNTHGHGDHIGAVADLKEATGATYGIHEADVELLSRDRQWMTLMIPGSKEPPDPDIFVKDGDVFNLGDVELTAIETPGHTKAVSATTAAARCSPATPCSRGAWEGLTRRRAMGGSSFWASLPR